MARVRISMVSHSVQMVTVISQKDLLVFLPEQIENLEDLISEKDEQLKAHLTCNSTESTDSAISSMEESIFEKDKQIER